MPSGSRSRSRRCCRSLLLMFALALTDAAAGRADAAWPLPFIALFFAGSTIGMFAPLRIDHHGWQLALARPRGRRHGRSQARARRRGARASPPALSLAIGLEMMIYLALLGGGDGAALGRRPRPAAAAGGLCGGARRRRPALGFLLFASYANRQAVCDALSPVWLSRCGARRRAAARPGDAQARRLEGAAWRWRSPRARVVAGFHALAWPHCLQRLEGVSPEATELWLEPCARGAAVLSPRLADRDGGRWRCR